MFGMILVLDEVNGNMGPLPITPMDITVIVEIGLLFFVTVGFFGKVCQKWFSGATGWGLSRQVKSDA
jgi:hypothetical protein